MQKVSRHLQYEHSMRHAQAGKRRIEDHTVRSYVKRMLSVLNPWGYRWPSVDYKFRARAVVLNAAGTGGVADDKQTCMHVPRCMQLKQDAHHRERDRERAHAGAHRQCSEAGGYMDAMQCACRTAGDT